MLVKNLVDLQDKKGTLISTKAIDILSKDKHHAF